MNKAKRQAKEAIISIIDDQLKKAKSLAEQVYLTESKEKHENDLRSDEILLRSRERRYTCIFRRQNGNLN